MKHMTTFLLGEQPPAFKQRLEAAKLLRQPRGLAVDPSLFLQASLGSSHAPCRQTDRQTERPESLPAPHPAPPVDHGHREMPRAGWSSLERDSLDISIPGPGCWGTTSDLSHQEAEAAITIEG